MFGPSKRNRNELSSVKYYVWWTTTQLVSAVPLCYIILSSDWSFETYSHEPRLSMDNVTPWNLWLHENIFPLISAGNPLEPFWVTPLLPEHSANYRDRWTSVYIYLTPLWLCLDYACGFLWRPFHGLPAVPACVIIFGIFSASRLQIIQLYRRILSLRALSLKIYFVPYRVDGVPYLRPSGRNNLYLQMPEMRTFRISFPNLQRRITLLTDIVNIPIKI